MVVDYKKKIFVQENTFSSKKFLQKNVKNVWNKKFRSKIKIVPNIFCLDGYGFLKWNIATLGKTILCTETLEIAIIDPVLRAAGGHYGLGRFLPLGGHYYVADFNFLRAISRELLDSEPSFIHENKSVIQYKKSLDLCIPPISNI